MPSISYPAGTLQWRRRLSGNKTVRTTVAAIAFNTAVKIIYSIPAGCNNNIIMMSVVVRDRSDEERPEKPMSFIYHVSAQ